jgi:hypothetical protein
MSVAAVPHDQTRILAMDAEDSAGKLKRKLAVILASDVAGYSRWAAQTFAGLIGKHEGVKPADDGGPA